LISLSNLSNHILATKSSKNLAKLKQRHSSHFSLTTTTTRNDGRGLWSRAIEMLGNHHYRQPVRKYVLELFEGGFDSRDEVDKLVQAGEELVRKGKEQRAEGGTGSVAIERMMAGGGEIGTGARGGGGLEGEVTEDEDQSSLDGNDLGDYEIAGEMGGKKVPLQVLTPMLTVRGFLLS
jgi:hypothetical protein